MVVCKNSVPSLLIQINGIVQTRASLKTHLLKQDEFFLTGSLTSLSASFEFECLFKFLPDESQFLIQKIDGLYEDENTLEEVTSIDQIADDETELWTHFNLLFMTIFALQEVQLVW